jgi:asparagine synthase (glutamine-hydrolysing)
MIRGEVGDFFLKLKWNGTGCEVNGKESVFLGYRFENDDPAERDDGVWAEWRWDGETFRFHNDDLGFLPVYFTTRKDELHISNKLFLLLEPGDFSDLDDEAIAVFLRTGFFPGEDTAFRRIKLVPPGCSMTWSRGELDLRSALPSPGATYTGSRRQAQEEYEQLLRTNISSCLPDPDEKWGMPLSGGRDSRHLLFLLQGAGRLPTSSLTVAPKPPKSREDLDVAREICARVGCPHQVLEPSFAVPDIELRKNYLTSFSAIEHSWIIAVIDHCRRNGFTLLYDGIGGDVLSAAHFFLPERHDLYLQGQYGALAEHILKPEGYLPKILKPGYYSRWSREKAVARLCREFGQFEDFNDPVDQFFLWNRTRRGVAVSTWGILADTGQVVAPFLHRPIYRFLVSLPMDFCRDKTFHTEVIQASYPEYADIRFERAKAAPTSLGRPVVTRSLLAAGRYLWKNPQPIFGRGFYFKRMAKGLIDKEFGLRFLHQLDFAIYLAQLHEKSR